METIETKKHIENIIKETFYNLKGVFRNQQEKDGNQGHCKGNESHILYPKYRNGNTRFSEQELRFVFVEQLNIEINKGWDVYYSVETPTRERYLFKDKYNPKVFGDNEDGGQSAQFDLAIHDNLFHRIALIEFKANNAPVEHHKKDYIKLNTEGNENVLTYFIEVVKHSNNGTDKSINEKQKGFHGKFRWTVIEQE